MRFFRPRSGCKNFRANRAKPNTVRLGTGKSHMNLDDSAARPFTSRYGIVESVESVLRKRSLTDDEVGDDEAEQRMCLIGVPLDKESQR
jgi:hypothetical protein